MLKGHTGAGIGLLYCIIVVGLIAAKIAGHLHFGWWLVLSPIWAPIALIVIAVLFAIIGFAGAQSRGENPFQ